MSFRLFILCSSNLPVTVLSSPRLLPFVFFISHVFLFSPFLHIFVFFGKSLNYAVAALSSAAVRYCRATARLFCTKCYFFIYPQHCHQILPSLLCLSLHFFSHLKFAAIIFCSFLWLAHQNAYTILPCISFGSFCALFSRWKHSDATAMHTEKKQSDWHQQGTTQ